MRNAFVHVLMLRYNSLLEWKYTFYTLRHAKWHSNQFHATFRELLAAPTISIIIFMFESTYTVFKHFATSQILTLHIRPENQ